MSFYEDFFKLSIAERKAIADKSGISLGYILKHTYVSDRDPKFHFHNAVALDKASDGSLPFYRYTEGGIDWGYILDRLKKAKRKGEIVEVSHD